MNAQVIGICDPATDLLPIKERLLYLYHQEHLSIRQVASRLGLGPTTIARYLQKHRISTRSSPEGQRYRLQKDGRFGGYRNILLTPTQREFIFGTLLGDGSLSLRGKHTNARFKVSHTGKDIGYLRFKWDVLSDFVTGNIYWDTHHNQQVNKVYHSYSFITCTHPELTPIFQLFYKNGRKIVDLTILNQINPFGLAVWIMDDGYYNYPGKHIELYTMGFTFVEHTLMIEWFGERFSVHPKVVLHKQCNKYYLRFNQADTQRLIEIIQQHIVPCMSRKIGL